MSRLRRLDDAFLRKVEELLPPRRGVQGHAPWVALIGVGFAFITVSTMLWLLVLVSDYEATDATITSLSGIVILSLGIVLSRRWQKRHEQ